MKKRSLFRILKDELFTQSKYAIKIELEPIRNELHYLSQSCEIDR